MSKRIEQIREKLKGTKLAGDFDIFAKTLQDNIENEIRGGVAGSMIKEVTAVVTHVKELLAHRDQGFRDISAYLENQTKHLDFKDDTQEAIYRDILGAIKALINNLGKEVSIKNASEVKLTKSELKSAFIDALDSVEKILISQNELAYNTEYEWSGDRLTKITEKYEGFNLVTTLKYNSFGHIISETIEKV